MDKRTEHLMAMASDPAKVEYRKQKLREYHQKFKKAKEVLRAYQEGKKQDRMVYLEALELVASRKWNKKKTRKYQTRTVVTHDYQEPAIPTAKEIELKIEVAKLTKQLEEANRIVDTVREYRANKREMFAALDAFELAKRR
jgi:hypothetical protein